MFLIIVAVIIFVVWFYVLYLREWAVALWPERFTKWHAIEDKLWKNSRTILVSRLTWILGVLAGLHEWAAVAGFDVTPIYEQIAELMPETYQKFTPLLISLMFVVVGYVFERLRKTTTEPLEEKPSAENP